MAIQMQGLYNSMAHSIGLRWKRHQSVHGYTGVPKKLYETLDTSPPASL